MGILVFGVLVVTTALWWMLFDLWPQLPASIPLWPFGDDAARHEVARSVAWWFGPPAVVTVLAVLLGLLAPRRLAARADRSAWLPVPRANAVRRLPPDSRARIVQPIRLGLAFAAFCLLTMVGHWWNTIAEAAMAHSSSGGRPQAAWPLLGALVTAGGASWTIAKVRANKELAAFVQACGTLHDGPTVT
ncbi:MAG: hypothetical protein U1F60_13490 [Planctomycetota bacterium]